eukprot:TRINITY_DN27173_c0_g1_i1.p1 TRINITY_DN27173_c0_g1~~TRINITY_DN27173_c0_g1_i1.p1  ORF type:complete len:717 (+),score=137.27 TRINITY_DN27173_c0_g1_i1:195-2345(+)
MRTARRTSTEAPKCVAFGSTFGQTLRQDARRRSSPTGRDKRQSSGAGTSPVRGTWGQPSATTMSDQERMWAEAIGTMLMLEPALRTLQSEHNALRAEAQALRNCLNRAGVLAAGELEREMVHCAAIKIGGPLDNSICSTAVSEHQCLEADVLLRLSSPPVGRGAGLSPIEAVSSHGMSPGPGRPQGAAIRRTSRSLSPSCERSGRSPLRERQHAVDEGGNEKKVWSSRSPTLLAETVASRSRQRSRSPGAEAGSRTGKEAAADVVGSPTNRGLKYRSFFELTQLLLEEGTSPTERPSAVMQRLQQLLRSGAESPNAWSGPGTPLATAVQAGRLDLARVLLRAKALPSQRDSKGVTPLHMATFDGNAELCRALLAANADVDACDRHGQTPLFFAPNVEVCVLMLDKQADVSLLNRRGQSALHLAARAGMDEVLACLTGSVPSSLVALHDIAGLTAHDYLKQNGAAGSAEFQAAAGPCTGADAVEATTAGPKVTTRSAELVAAYRKKPVAAQLAGREQPPRSKPTSPVQFNLFDDVMNFAIHSIEGESVASGPGACSWADGSNAGCQDNAQVPVFDIEDMYGEALDLAVEQADFAAGGEVLFGLRRSGTAVDLLEAAAAVATAAVETAAATASGACISSESVFVHDLGNGAGELLARGISAGSLEEVTLESRLSADSPDPRRAHDVEAADETAPMADPWLEDGEEEDSQDPFGALEAW